ncbi:MAG: adenylate/guanylate cyclase domain-containing protein [Bdellovibrionota bacterium]
MKLSISLKLLISLSILIFGMTASIAYFNAEYLKKTILQRERDFNLSITEAKAKEINAFFDKQIKAITSSAKQLLDNPEATDFFKDNPDLLSLEIVDADKIESKSIVKKDGWAYTENENLNSQRLKFVIDLVVQAKQNPDRIYTMNSSALYPPLQKLENKKNTSVITLVIPYSLLDKKLDQVIVANLSTEFIQRIFSNTKLGTLKLFNDWGYSIVGSDEAYLTRTENISKTDIYSFIKSYPLPNYSGLYEQNQHSAGTMLSFAKTQRGLFLLSEIPAEVLIAPAQLIALMTLRLSGYFFAASLFLLFIFSSKLTQPLEKLSEISLEIAKGNFEHKPGDVLKQFFKDEVYALSIAVDRMVKGLKERNRFKTLFDKFHGSAVTADLMKNEVALRGEKKRMFVFFSDLRGFTGLSESKDPSQVVELLNEYFSYMVPVINQHGGVVDKFIGDAIMAVWGVPHEKPDDGKNALMACIKMRIALEKLNQTRKQRNEPELWIGMALHFGEAISGTIGSEERMEYTVIGNTINTASRIEASTKAFGTDLLVSEEVKEKLINFLYTEAGAVEVKGRSEPIKLYKVNGYIDENGLEVVVKTLFSDYTPEAADKVKIVS